jgi:phage shock protein C
MAAKFMLDKSNAKLLGVCAGIAAYTGVEALWVRVAMVGITLLGSGVPILLYILVALLAEAQPAA